MRSILRSSILCTLLVYTNLLFNCAYAQSKSQIQITIKLADEQLPLKELSYSSAEEIGQNPARKIIGKTTGSSTLFIFEELSPISVSILGKTYFAEPGDKVVLNFNSDSLVVSGNGAKKYQLADKIRQAQAKIKKPSNPKDYLTKSKEDYLEWYDYFNKQLDVIVPLIDSFRNKLSPTAYTYTRASFINQIIDDHSDKFAQIRWGYEGINLTKDQAIELFDTKYKPSVDRYLPYTAAIHCKSWKPVWWMVDRKHDFENYSENRDTALIRWLEYYDVGKRFFSNKAREEFVYKVLYKEIIRDFGFLPAVEERLQDYLKEKTYPEHKRTLREAILKLRERANAKSAPDFELVDRNGNKYTKSSLKGKLAILDFWFTGCVGCLQMTPALKKLEQEFKNDTNVVFLSVSVDKDRTTWLKGISEKKYTTGSAINLYTGGKGTAHDMISYYGITGYPSLILIDAYGSTISVVPKLDPRTPKGYQLMSNEIKTQLTKLEDGPYIIYKGGNTKIDLLNISALTVNQSSSVDKPDSMNVQTDRYGKKIKIGLKKSLKPEQSIYQPCEKLLVLSDIEGNFEALSKLLMANKVIDNQYNWTFGTGHLVFAGDMFDRGDQVTQCLWLLYSLEEKAKSSGGYVHFILGNHELMNLKGDHNYVQPKYKINAVNSKVSLKELYGENTELGRWLRTKNIIERIGSHLFVHGGIGIEFNEAVSLGIDEINSLARRFYSDEHASESADKNVRMIFHQILGPLWYRRYYESGNKAFVSTKDTTQKLIVHHPTQAQLNAILKGYAATHIITGHTIIADTISVLYDNKVINTDVPHAKNKSEALLIEGNAFYRVDDKGQRFLLFKDEEMVLEGSK